MKRQTEFKWPRKLRSNEIIVIEHRIPLYNGKWSKWQVLHAYPPGCEHDAHGVATVNAKMHVNAMYRLVIFKRSEIL